MLTLYHHPRTRSSRFISLLEELGVPYVIHRIASIRRPDGSGGVDPQNPHPHGKSPALKDGDTLVWESSAIALYLTDRFRQNRAGPLPGDPLRGPYVSWLAYYAGIMEPAWMSVYMKWDVPPGTAGWVKTDEVLAFVNTTLTKGPYILGEKFSAVDVLIATTFKLFMGTLLLEKTDLLEGYVDRVTGPAFARAQAKEEEVG